MISYYFDEDKRLDIYIYFALTILTKPTKTSHQIMKILKLDKVSN